MGWTRLVLLALAVFLILRFIFRIRTMRKSLRKFFRQAMYTGTAQTELLKKCPRCGTFFSEEKGIRKGQEWYCSEGCAR